MSRHYEIWPSGACDARWTRIRTRSGQEWVRGWRTRESTSVAHSGRLYYLSGEIIEARPGLDCGDEECAPGIYLWPTRRQAQSWAEDHPCSPRYAPVRRSTVIEVWTFAHLIHEVGGKARAAWVVAGDGRL